MEIEKFKEIMKAANPSEKEHLLEEIGKLIQNLDLKENQNSFNISEINNRFELFTQIVHFNKGDFVMWKDGLKNRLVPDYGQPVVVVDVLENPVITGSEETGSPYFSEPLSLIVGLIDEDNEFHCFHLDKRRFQKYKE